MNHDHKNEDQVKQRKHMKVESDVVGRDRNAATRLPKKWDLDQLDETKMPKDKGSRRFPRGSQNQIKRDAGEEIREHPRPHVVTENQLGVILQSNVLQEART